MSRVGTQHEMTVVPKAESPQNAVAVEEKAL